VIVPEIFRWLKTFAPFVFGGIMLLVVFFMPQGIAGLFEQVKTKLLQFQEEKTPRDVS